MTRLFLAAGVAALAIAAPASAERGGKAGGNKGHAASVERGSKAASAKSDRRSGGQRVAKVERRGGEQRFAKSARRGGGQRFAMLDRGKGEARKAERNHEADRMIKAERNDRREAKVMKFDRNDRRDIVRVGERRDDRRFGDRDGRRFADGHRGWNESFCPPGLDKKDNGCLPPGQAKRLLGQAIPKIYRQRLVPLALRDLYRDNDDYYYRYGDGYMYRVDRKTNLIASLLPLLTGGYATGQMFPTAYRNSYAPNYFQSFYPDTAGYNYRYLNGNVYGFNPSSGLIGDVIPMYGYGYGYGQMLPSSYSYYNVPYQYRDMYYDTNDSYYRYAPGAIYQVDRGSNLITAVASLLAGDLAVGNRLPLGYSAYNVPLSYRDNYYDTADSWYRYNDGYIYQVDPKTQLITAVINALV